VFLESKTSFEERPF